MAKPTREPLPQDIAALREEVELLELTVRKIQARAFISKFHADRKSKRVRAEKD